MATEALAGGAAGAAVLTLIHEAARRTIPDAPRMDILGRRAIVAGVRALNAKPPSRTELQGAALAGDLLSNTAYYSLVGLGTADGAVTRGGLLGLAAGLGAVFLPGPLGLGIGPSRRTPQTAAMTVALYTLGGVVAGAVYGCLKNDVASRSGRRSFRG